MNSYYIKETIENIKTCNKFIEKKGPNWILFYALKPQYERQLAALRRQVEK